MPDTPPYTSQDLLDAVIGQRNSFMNDVAVAQAIIKTKDEELKMLVDKKDQEIAILRTSQEQLLKQRFERDARIANQDAEIAALTASLVKSETEDELAV